MKKVIDIVRGGMAVHTDELIEAFDEASSCENSDCESPFHARAADIAEQLRHYQMWAEEPERMPDEIAQRKDDIADQIQAFAADAIVAITVASMMAPPPDTPIQ